MKDSIKNKEKNIFDQLKDRFKYTNIFQAPKLRKVVVSIGIGSIKDKNKIIVIEKSLALITGQKPIKTLAKKSIASFKVREGFHSGYKVTLRGKSMYLFLDKVINVALPRSKDFRGYSVKCVDKSGNLSFPIKDHSIFLETSNEELRNIFGFCITIDTSSINRIEAITFFQKLNFPFSKENKC